MGVSGVTGEVSYLLFYIAALLPVFIIPTRTGAARRMDGSKMNLLMIMGPGALFEWSHSAPNTIIGQLRIHYPVGRQHRLMKEHCSRR